MAFSSKFPCMESDALLTAHSSPCPGQGKGFRSSSLPSQGIPGLQLCHCYYGNPSLVLGGQPEVSVILKHQCIPSLPTAGTAVLGSLSLVVEGVFPWLGCGVGTS